VERDSVHELTAAYALDALDDHEASAYEDHLAHCPACQAELASFQETAGSLAYGAPAADPPDGLRDRILDAARRERETVVPLRPRRRATVAFGAAAAVAATVAIVLGVWAVSLSSTLDDERSARSADAQALAILTQPGATSHPVDGGPGTLVVAPNGDAVLVLAGLDDAPAGKTYEAWVSADGIEMFPAGTFQSGGETTAVRLARAVPPGGLVAVTVEDEGGADQPTGDPFLTASTT
jgi:anti-sigma factor RsiW